MTIGKDLMVVVQEEITNDINRTAAGIIKARVQEIEAMELMLAKAKDQLEDLLAKDARDIAYNADDKIYTCRIEPDGPSNGFVARRLY